MSTRFAAPAALTFALLPLQLGAVEGYTFRWHGKLNAGQTLEIKGVNGAIRAEPAPGKSVEVSADKTGHRHDPDSVEIKVVEHAEGLTVCAVYPSSGSRQNECQPGARGLMNAAHNDVKVDFVVRIPQGLRLKARTVNGNVEANSLATDVDAHTVNGDIRLSTSGTAQASTINGSITASLSDLRGSEGRTFSTVNGNITLQLPARADSEIQARTVNGRISTDFPLTLRGKFLGKSLEGTLGRGGRALTLKTINGSITLRRDSGRSI